MRKFTTILTLLTAVYSIYSQDITERDIVRITQEADIYLFYYNNYRKAASLYGDLYELEPGNHNLAAKLGIAYLNIESKRQKAIPLLRFASENIAPTERDYSDLGSMAPTETLYYLANAYHVNDSLEAAVRTYRQLLESLPEDNHLERDYIMVQIDACKRALAMREEPMPVEMELFSDLLSQFPGAGNPVLSGNDSLLLFSRERDDGTIRIYSSFRDEHGEWQPPEDITESFGRGGNLIPNSLTADGGLLVLSLYNEIEGNLYYSEREGQRWSRARRFPRNISSRYFEDHGFITPDGNTLFFSSNRPGGHGELDLYVSHRTGQRRWSEPENLGSTINSQYNENRPFFDTLTSTLWFSSERSGGLGGYSFFTSKLKDERWSAPELLPYPVSTTADNLFIGLIPHSDRFITSRLMAGGEEINIYTIRVIPADERVIQRTIIGVVVPGDGTLPDLEALSLQLFYRDGTVAEWESIESGKAGEFVMVVDSGDFILKASHPGYMPDSIFIDSDSGATGRDINVTLNLTPEEVYRGDFLFMRTILFGFDDYTLSDEAKEGLERLASVLRGRDSLKLKVTGYTDSSGNQEYNRELSLRRAEAVAGYLRARAPSSTDIVVRGEGASQFVAKNRLADGSDNPEGRGFNRRVTIGIEDPGTGITIVPDIWLPPHMRHPASERYGIVLIETTEMLHPGHFSGLEHGDQLFIRPFSRDSDYLYILGDFPDRAAAATHLERVREAGFMDATLISLYDTAEDVTPATDQTIGLPEEEMMEPLYTIQLFAGRGMPPEEYFGSLAYTILLGDDNLYRFVTGRYSSFREASGVLRQIRDMGYSDAFIRNYRAIKGRSKLIREENDGPDR